MILVAAFVCADIISDIKERQYHNRNEKLLADNIEIERKWIVDPDIIYKYKAEAVVIDIEQTYISFSPEIRVRRLNNGQRYTMTIKNNLTNDGIQRDRTFGISC